MHLRPLDPALDFPRVADLFSQAEPEPTTVDELIERENAAPEGLIRQRLVAVDDAGVVVGYCASASWPWEVAGKFWITVLVDSAGRRKGLGSQLYAAALQFAREHDAVRLLTEVRDSLPEALALAERRGFCVDRHLFESALDLASFDERPFAGIVEGVEAKGIRFLTLADLGDTEEARRRLYEINRLYASDIPGRETGFQSFEQFQRSVFGASWYRPEGQFVAADGDDWVGMSAVGYFAQTNSMYNMMTGVDRAYRGRHIALALKLLTIRLARRLGAAYVRTNNDSENAPMLAVNRKLGYRPQPGIYQMLGDAVHE